jgi:glycine/D-amino acid oxidase-like deaminating enzyme
MSPVSDAEYLVIGGGAIGCGVAFYLAEAGITDVLVLEKEPALAAVTTSQAAGLVGQVRSSVERTRLAMESVRTFSRMQGDPELQPGWRQVGSLRLALTAARVEEFSRLKAVADQSGLEAHFLDAGEAGRLWPAMDFSRVLSILWCPSDGYLQPHDLTLAYAGRARRLGVRFATGAQVLEILTDKNGVQGVATSRGTARCRVVINAAGAHAYHVARLAGLELPIVPVRHEYFITVAAPGLFPTLPVVRIPDSTLYLRAELNSLLLGGWEPRALSTRPDTFGLRDPPPPIDTDWEVLSAFGAQLQPQWPAIRDLGIRGAFKGWPTFTPDGRFIIGESSRVRGFVMAGGCNAHGVSGSAGIGRHVVESLIEKDPSPYVKSLSPDRFTERPWDWSAAQRQAQRVYETYYALDH